MIETGIEHVKVGDYYIPNLTVPQKWYNIGKYGNLHKKFIKEHNHCFYLSMLMNGTLLEYLEKVDIKAKNEVDRLIKEIAAAQGITEELKATNQMKWVGMMNNIKHSAEEIVYSTIVYNREAL